MSGCSGRSSVAVDHMPIPAAPTPFQFRWPRRCRQARPHSPGPHSAPRPPPPPTCLMPNREVNLVAGEAAGPGVLPKVDLSSQPEYWQFDDLAGRACRSRSPPFFDSAQASGRSAQRSRRGWPCLRVPSGWLHRPRSDRKRACSRPSSRACPGSLRPPVVQRQ